MSASPSHLRAIGFALVGFTCWVIGDMFLKLAGEFSVPKYQIMTFGGAGGMISVFIFTALRGQLSQLRPRHGKILATLRAFIPDELRGLDALFWRGCR